MTETKVDEKPVDEQILNGTDATAPKEPAPKRARTRGSDGRFSDDRDDVEDAAFDAAMKKHLVREPEAKQPEKVEPAATPEKTEETGPVKVPKALEFDGWTAEDLQGLSQERIDALSKKAEKRQADINKKLSEKSKAEDKQTTASPETAKATSDTAAVAQQSYKDMVKGVSDLLGDDVGDALGKVLEGSMKPLLQRLEAAESALQQSQLSDLNRQYQTTRGELEGEFPQLKDDEVNQRVIERMGQLADPEKYDSLEALMRDACRLELYDEVVKAKASESKPNTDTSRKNGHPTAPTRSKVATPKSREQADDEALDAVFKKHLGRG
jgi:hypothetical protein